MKYLGVEELGFVVPQAIRVAVGIVPLLLLEAEGGSPTKEVPDGGTGGCRIGGASGDPGGASEKDNT